MLKLIDGRYKCSWCEADLNLPFTRSETMAIVTEHDGETVQIIMVNGVERHRCALPAEPN